MNIVISPLDAFYISGAIMLLAIAIIVYPTLKYGSKDEKPHRKSAHR